MKKDVNYLDKIPAKAPELAWEINEDGLVTLIIENKGFFNKMAQLLFKKPKKSYIHLDETGSFLWKNTDGQKNLGVLGEELYAEFGEKANPLYERLIKYYKILESYGYIMYK